MINSCINVDGDLRLKNDLEVMCYKGEHIFWALGVGVPSIVVWGMGIPLFALILLIKERKIIESRATREKLGFLFRGYKTRFFYWEIVIMFRKIVLIFI